MKVRSKNKKEKQYDELQLDQARRSLAETAANFLEEYEVCSDVWNKTRVEFRDRVWEYEREKEHSQMTRVGESWDFENKICSVYRYKFADVATSGR